MLLQKRRTPSLNLTSTRIHARLTPSKNSFSNFQCSHHHFRQDCTRLAPLRQTLLDLSKQPPCQLTSQPLVGLCLLAYGAVPFRSRCVASYIPEIGKDLAANCPSLKNIHPQNKADTDSSSCWLSVCRNGCWTGGTRSP